MSLTYTNVVALAAVIIVGLSIYEIYKNNDQWETRINQKKFILTIFSALIVTIGFLQLTSYNAPTTPWNALITLGIGAILLFLLSIPITIKNNEPKYKPDRLVVLIPLVFLCGVVYLLLHSNTSTAVDVTFVTAILLLGVLAAYQDKKFDTRILSLTLPGSIFVLLGFLLIFPQLAKNIYLEDIVASNHNLHVAGGALVAVGWILFSAGISQ